MFYAQYVLSKKGPLAKIWLAAHWEKKLTKAQIFETNIDRAVESILEPKAKMALRTTGHLLLGIVRIYSRKTKYLLADCNEAFLKIKMAFRPGILNIDLPEDRIEADVDAITLPEVFHDFDSALPDFSELEYADDISSTQGKLDQITMKEDAPKVLVDVDDEFDDADGFDSFELPREEVSQFLDDASIPQLNTAEPTNNEPVVAEKTVEVLSDTVRLESTEESTVNVMMDTDLEMFPTNESSAAEEISVEVVHCKEEPATVPSVTETASAEMRSSSESSKMTTLVHDEDEEFALEPLESIVTQIPAKVRVKRKRRLLVDNVKTLSGDDIKSQLHRYSDTLGSLDLAPPTVVLMKVREAASVDKLFSLQGIPCRSPTLNKFWKSAIGSKMAKFKADSSRMKALEATTLEKMRGMDGTNSNVERSTLSEIELQPSADATLTEANEMIDVIPSDMQSLDEPDMTTLSDLETVQLLGNSGATINSELDLSKEEWEHSDESAKDRRWTKRSQLVLNQFETKFKTTDKISFKVCLFSYGYGSLWKIPLYSSYKLTVLHLYCMPLGQAIAYLQRAYQIFKGIELVYSDKDPLVSDVVVNLTNNGIKLLFDASSQLLKVIEIIDMNKVCLSYSGMVFSTPSKKPSIEKVNETFGATHPGGKSFLHVILIIEIILYDSVQHVYILSWRGLSMLFPAEQNLKPFFTRGLSSLHFADGTTLFVSKIVIYHGNSLTETTISKTPVSCYHGQCYAEKIEVMRSDVRTFGLNITLSSERVDCTSYSNNSPEMLNRLILFGDSCQKVASALGFPNAVYYKSEDKMRIHLPSAQRTKCNEKSDYFYNYFTMGLVSNI
ncbi:Rad21 / Rec8 like protein [Trichinella nativa]|uniref:Rad21 / Rec8 like protein n=1 Tax=Trichinella nativa TaxID=6335 RepID=A0A1Y3ESB2_9BILA|nr:Rad21 / Rec8 like protein [Trichinella nativa]